MKKVLITEICDILVGRTPSRYNPDYWGTGFPWLSIADMNQGELLSTTKETITAEAVKECNCKQIPKGTVLFSFKLSIGKVGITAVDMFTNEAIAAFLIKDKSRLDTKFLFYTLKSTDYSVGSNKAVMGKTLNKEQLKKFTIPLPPIEEQHRIVKILDLAQSLIEKRKRAIAYLDDYIKAVFLDMFGDLVSNPKGWEVKTLKELTIKIGSGATPKGGKAAYLTRGISLIRSLNIHDNSFHYKDLAFINDQQAKELSSVVVKQNDVLLNITGASVARCVIVPDSVLPARVNQHVAILRPTDEIKSTFLLHLLISENYKRQLLLNAAEGGATREALTKQQLEKFEIICPAIEAQIKFCEIVEKIEKIKQKMQTQLKELENNFQAQLQRAFKGCVKFQ